MKETQLLLIEKLKHKINSNTTVSPEIKDSKYLFLYSINAADVFDAIIELSDPPMSLRELTSILRRD